MRSDIPSKPHKSHYYIYNYTCSLRLILWLRKRSVRRNVVRSVKYLPEREALHDHIYMHHVCTHE